MIIQVSDSIAWVRCASRNWQCYVGDGGGARQKGGQVHFSRPTLMMVVSSRATLEFWHTTWGLRPLLNCMTDPIIYPMNNPMSDPKKKPMAYLITNTMNDVMLIPMTHSMHDRMKSHTSCIWLIDRIFSFYSIFSIDIIFWKKKIQKTDNLTVYCLDPQWPSGPLRSNHYSKELIEFLLLIEIFLLIGHWYIKPDIKCVID